MCHAFSQGYTIPLDKRLAADGRGLQETTVSEKFAAFTESLYSAEHKAREALHMRNKVHSYIPTKEDQSIGLIGSKRIDGQREGKERKRA